MFYSRQIYTFLVEIILNYVFKEEKKIDLDSNKTEAITKRFFYEIALLSLMSETLKNTYEEVPFFSKVEARSLHLC